MGASFTPLSLSDQALLQVVCAGLPLSEEPFADLGRALGISGESALARLRSLAASGCIDGLKLVTTGSDAVQARDAIEMQLLDALSSGLPLVQRPWEALGAVLGVSAERVRLCVTDWQTSGTVRCIAPTLHGHLLQF